MIGSNFFTPISAATKIAFADQNGLALFGVVNTTPETQANTYSKGCLLIRTDNGTLYQNTGTSASPSWTVNGVGAVGPTGPLGPTGYTGASVIGATGSTGYTGYTA